jgi:two-component sensor histidine kinase
MTSHIPLPHPKETARIAALRSYGVLDTEPDPAFDAITALAARICNTPIALVSLVDKERQWFKSRHNFEVTETPRDVALCAHAILLDEPLVVPDTHADPRFSSNPLCSEGPVRFYAGVPLLSHGGLPLGTLCVIDERPHPDGVTPDQLVELKLLADQTSRLLELQRLAERQATALRESIHRTKNVLAVASAIASRTMSGGRTIEDAKNILLGRFRSLGQAQNYLLTASNEGASLIELVHGQTSAFLPDGDSRLTISGPDVTISGEAAEAIGLALHELSTNALKYGSLAAESGQVTIEWRRGEEDALILQWRETGGLPPKPDAARTGFGSMVLGKMCAQKIGGNAVLTLPAEGAIWTAHIAAHHLRSPAAES